MTGVWLYAIAIIVGGLFVWKFVKDQARHKFWYTFALEQFHFEIAPAAKARSVAARP